MNPVVPLIFFFMPFNPSYQPNPELSGIILEIDMYTHEYVFENFTVPLFVDEAPYGASLEEDEDMLIEEVDDNPLELAELMDLTST